MFPEHKVSALEFSLLSQVGIVDRKDTKGVCIFQHLIQEVEKLG